MRRSAILGAACILATSMAALACSNKWKSGQRRIPGNVAAVKMSLSGDFSGASVRISGARAPFAGGAYSCSNSVVACLNFDDDGSSETLVGLCPSEDDPSGTWTFSYELFGSPSCAGTQLTNVDCPVTIDETLPAGEVTVNAVSCSSETSGVGFQFQCADGSVCIPPTVTYSGDAYGVQTSTGISYGVGPLPSSGGQLSNSFTNISLAGLGTIGAIDVMTEGAGLEATSTATSTGISLSVVGLATITATLIGGHSEARCPPAVDGGATITSLVVKPPLLPPIVITPSGAPNQVIVGLPIGLSIILNEQVTSVTADAAEITVTAAHLTILGTEVRIGRAHSDVTCMP